MDVLSGHALPKETLSTCVRALNRVQAHSGVSTEERHAISQLLGWLAVTEPKEDSDSDNNLDESSKAYLASYKEKFGRKRLTKGSGELLGISPRVRNLMECFHHPPYKLTVLYGTPQAHAFGGKNGRLDSWEGFDVFRVASLTHGRPLETVAVALIRRFELIDKLQLPQDKLCNFLRAIEACYNNSNPYHNSTHAADVTQSLGCIMAHDAFTAQLTDMELLSMIIACCVHDVGHPGVSNEFLINTGAETALMYNDNSVNENMHTAKAFQILLVPQNNFVSHLPEQHFKFFRRTLISIILSTDMAGHTDLIRDFAANMLLLGSDLSKWPLEKRTQALQMCVHCADIANPAKPLRFSLQWTDRVQTEFYSQGDQERQRGLPVSPLCDRDRVEVPQSQLIFLERVVRPCYKALQTLAPIASAKALAFVEDARRHWEAQQAASQAGPRQDLHQMCSEHSSSGNLQSGASRPSSEVFPIEDCE